MIKQQYLGNNKPKKRIVRPSEKFKFNFDWGADEDTSKDLNPLYATPHGAARVRVRVRVRACEQVCWHVPTCVVVGVAGGPGQAHTVAALPACPCPLTRPRAARRGHAAVWARHARGL